jgi:transposase
LSKYSYEEKLESVLRVIDEGMSYAASANVLGTCKKAVERWVKMYQKFGTQGLLMKHGSYTGDFKVSVIEYMHANHLSLFETAITFGIPTHGTVSNWERIYYEEGPQGLYKSNRGRKSKMNSDKPKKKNFNKEMEEDLIAEVQRLRMENEYLKKLQALVQKRIAQENGNEPPSSMN